MLQKGFSQIIILVVLLVGVGLGVYLVQFTQVFRPKANSTTIDYAVSFQHPDSVQSSDSTFTFTFNIQYGTYGHEAITGMERINLYEVGASNNQPLASIFLNCDSQQPVGFEDPVSKTCTIQNFMKDSAKKYELRMFASDGVTVVALSNPISVVNTNQALDANTQNCQQFTYNYSYSGTMGNTQSFNITPAAGNPIKQVQVIQNNGQYSVYGQIYPNQDWGPHLSFETQPKTLDFPTSPILVVISLTDTRLQVNAQDGVMLANIVDSCTTHSVKLDKNGLVVQSPSPLPLGTPDFTNNTAATCVGTTSRIHLEWKPVQGVSVYRVFRSISTDPNVGTYIAQQSNTEYNDDTVSPGLSYVYRVVATYDNQQKTSRTEPLAAIACSSPSPNATPLKGDINGDHKVNIFDVNQFINDFITKNLKSDLNGDGKVDIFDFNFLMQNYGK